MPAAQQAITVYCGRDFYLAVTNVTGLGNPFNLTGYICYLTIKKAISDADASALFSQAPWSSNLSFGKLTFKIPHTTTSAWWTSSGPIGSAIVYDISYADNASPKNWNTVLYGPVTLVEPTLQTIPGG
jgi:hypothetical protein